MSRGGPRKLPKRRGQGGRTRRLHVLKLRCRETGGGGVVSSDQPPTLLLMDYRTFYPKKQ